MAELPGENSKLEEKSIERMPYLRAVLKESLRFHSPAPLNARILNRSFELGGYQFPPGECRQVKYSISQLWVFKLLTFCITDLLLVKRVITKEIHKLFVHSF
jgi:hypothetical protein